ncbi:hypothetical protein CAPTEDRAFT_217280 [Capitella teleta]|uniref:Uncharacterized protein n=1 Tax=Capitella teleta TaxID=283909 RepID=R7TGA6_CAPTE|nr:hypothetical protein CAPTEDRAFT_217280 [Capitella teleta]|eukprot:ELT90596.1 hypothetical protein CAPTEDRAFT_217280 [Capitella teleta]
MTAESYLDKNHVQGVRARSLILNNATSFTMLHEEHFLYDSSLVLQQPEDYKDIRTDIWPVFSFIPMSNLNWKNKKVWLLPVNPIVNPPYRARVYLDDCKMSRSEQVLWVLKKNFNQFYDNDRAPFQVNFRSDFVMDKDMRKGLRSFVDWLAIHEDVWLVTHQEAIEWMKAPFPKERQRDSANAGNSEITTANA